MRVLFQRVNDAVLLFHLEEFLNSVGLNEQRLVNRCGVKCMFACFSHRRALIWEKTGMSTGHEVSTLSILMIYMCEMSFNSCTLCVCVLFFIHFIEFCGLLRGHVCILAFLLTVSMHCPCETKKTMRIVLFHLRIQKNKQRGQYGVSSLCEFTEWSVQDLALFILTVCLCVSNSWAHQFYRCGDGAELACLLCAFCLYS